MKYRTFENITFWPIFHYRMEFASVVRNGLLADPPDVVAVEFPGTWREPILQGVNRLPYLSLVLGESEASNLYLPIEPTDGGIEALRTGRELGLPVELIDLDVDRYPFHHDSLPDSHTIYRLGYDRVMSAYYDNFGFDPDPLDEQREILMAHSLQKLAGEFSRVACVVGAIHLPGLLAKLPIPQPRPLARVKPRSLRLFNWSVKSSREFLSEPPFLAAAYEHSRGGERGTGQSDQSGESVWETFPGVDREEASETLVLESARAYQERYKEEISLQQLNILARFAKKYAMMDGMLMPDLFHLVVAARGVADDDLAYEVWDRGSFYPWQDGSGMLPTLDIDETHAYLEGRRITLHRKIRRNRPRLANYSEKKRLREKYAGDWKTQWSGNFICSHQPEDLVIEDYGRYLKHKAKGMLSAERTRIEPFQVSLKDGIDVRETLRNWHEKKLYIREVLPLAGNVGSLVLIFDEDLPKSGGVGGSLGLVGEDYPWLVTWLGEHAQESDMALYATPAGEEIVGPGISRCEYGGFMLSYPPHRLFDVWQDPFFSTARTKPERLLMAALDYSVERHVLYVAEHPPRSWFHSLAERLGKKLVYLPLGQLSPNTLKKVRSFHVLDGNHVRSYAQDFIG